MPLYLVTSESGEMGDDVCVCVCVLREREVQIIQLMRVVTYISELRLVCSIRALIRGAHSFPMSLPRSFSS